jgi:hypothetical protein
MEAEIKVLEGVMKANPHGRIQCVYCKSIRRLHNKEKSIFKAVKKSKIQTKILAAAAAASAAAASAASSNLSDEEQADGEHDGKSSYGETFSSTSATASTPHPSPNDETEPMDCTEGSDKISFLKLIFLCFCFCFIFSILGYSRKRRSECKKMRQMLSGIDMRMVPWTWEQLGQSLALRKF